MIDKQKLLSDFAKIFSATETSLNEGIGSRLIKICLSVSPQETVQSLIALREIGMRNDLENATVIMHGLRHRKCSSNLNR